MITLGEYCQMTRQILNSEVCLKCRGCCRFAQSETPWSVRLLKEEVQVLLLQNIPPSLFSREGGIRLLPNSKNKNYQCALLNEADNKCKVYSLRPLDCQLYPFMLRHKGKKVFLACDLNCPFAKENLEKEEFKEYTEYLNDLLNTPSSLKLLRSNPQIIQEYEGLLDLVEIKI